MMIIVIIEQAAAAAGNTRENSSVLFSVRMRVIIILQQYPTINQGYIRMPLGMPTALLSLPIRVLELTRLGCISTVTTRFSRAIERVVQF